MTAINGLTAGVTWGDADAAGYTGLYGSLVKPYQFSLNIAGGTIPTTGFTGSAVVTATSTAVPYSWSGSLTCRAPTTPASGYSGLVTWTTYSTNIHEWTCDVNWGEKQVTSFNGSSITAHSYIPLIASWRGTFAGYLDGTTPVTLPTLPAASYASLALKLLENTGTVDDTLTGTAAATQISSSATVGGGGDFSYSYEGSGDLVAAGDNYGDANTGIFTSGSLITPTENELVITAATGRTYTGQAFPTSVSWRVGVGSGIECVINFRGTSTLAIV